MGPLQRAPYVLQVSAESILQGNATMQEKAQFILRRSIQLSIGALLLVPSIARQTAWSQKAVAKGAQDYTHNVDPFIGVDWGGNTFVGSAIPFGLVKVGPDMETFDGRRSGFGYSSNGVILGFSHLHLSGAQGKYGNILVAPVTGPLDLNDIRTPRTDEVAKVGYYAANLTRYQVKAELTSSRRVGFHRYTFPASQQSHVTINVASAQGLARFTGGWNRGGEYRVFYYMILDTPAAATQTWTGNTLSASTDAAVSA